jgi:hypothetical protein
MTHILCLLLCMLGVFDLCYVRFMCARCCRSLLHTGYMHLLQSIFAMCTICVLSDVNPCCTFSRSHQIWCTWNREAVTTNLPSLRQNDDWIRVWRSVALPIPLQFALLFVRFGVLYGQCWWLQYEVGECSTRESRCFQWSWVSLDLEKLLPWQVWKTLTNFRNYFFNSSYMPFVSNYLEALAIVPLGFQIIAMGSPYRSKDYKQHGGI